MLRTILNELFGQPHNTVGSRTMGVLKEGSEEKGVEDTSKVLLG